MVPVVFGKLSRRWEGVFEGAGGVVVRCFVDGRAGEVLVGEGDVEVGEGEFFLITNIWSAKLY